MYILYKGGGYARKNVARRLLLPKYKSRVNNSFNYVGNSCNYGGTKMKCAIYTRVSTDNQAEIEFNSCEAQETKNGQGPHPEASAFPSPLRGHFVLGHST